MQLPEDKRKKIVDKSLGAVLHWLERFDTVIIGPGLGRDEMVHQVVIQVQLFLLLYQGQSQCLLFLLLHPQQKQSPLLHLPTSDKPF